MTIGDDDDSDEGDIANATPKRKKKRAELRNEDFVSPLTDLSRDIMNNGVGTMKIGHILERAVELQTKNNSPATKRMEKVACVEDILSRLRKERRTMLDNGEPQEEIDEIDKRIKSYRSMAMKLDQELSDGGK